MTDPSDNETRKTWADYKRRWLDELARHEDEGCPVCKATRGDVTQ